MSNAICFNATEIAKQVKAKAIITITYSGFNTIKVSSFRPQAFTYAFTNNHTILNTLSLVWGVQGFYYDGGPTTSQTIEETKQILKKITPCDFFVIHCNLIQISKIYQFILCNYAL